MTIGKQVKKMFFFQTYDWTRTLTCVDHRSRLDNALVHFLELVQKRHYEGWELVQAWC